MKYKNNLEKGFTLIELMVVIAVIALLSSVALIAMMSARQKSRDTKRLSDMTQMNTALALYYATNRGYPTSPNGIPSAITPEFSSSIPPSPMPADGNCAGLEYSSPPTPANTKADRYYYVTLGSPYMAPDGVTEVYPEYNYFFCLGNKTGNFSSGLHILTPQGVK